MLLCFPNIDTLWLALTSDVLPAKVVIAHAEFGQKDGDDRRWIRFAETLTQPQGKELKALGVTTPRSAKNVRFHAVSCWMEGLPVEAVSPQSVAIGEQTPVLFELSNAALLPELAGEILRLGNDRQSYQIVEHDEHSSALLRVIGPPYYSLLRALGESSDSNADGQTGVRAFVESAPRVWVEVGCRHPFAERITPAAGEHLLIDTNGTWRYWPERPFRDVYEIMSFELPSQPSTLSDIEVDSPITVPLRLVRGGGDNTAELWVLSRDATAQVEAFVQASSDEVLSRLAFAVVGETGDPTIVIRLRPGREAPPVLVFDAIPCRTYLRIPNLFLPIGQRVHPPLRRDVIKQMLAPDDNRLVWIEPTDEGQFVPRSIDDGALRPLTDWVDYVLDQHHEELDAWRQSYTFDFDEFICPDDKPKKPRQEVRKSPRAGGSSPKPVPTLEEKNESGPVEKVVKKQRPRGAAVPAPKAEEIILLEKQVEELEQKFLADASPLDDPSRSAQWREMAQINGQLGRLGDASICRLHELWEAEVSDSETVAVWLNIELQSSRRHGACVLIDDDQQDITELSLARLLTIKSPTPVEVAELAAYLTFAVTSGDARPIEKQFGRVTQFLLRNESMLPVRSCWLAWRAVSQLSGGDVLALARARDRLLQRLHEQGLSPDGELPAFLRSSGGETGQRYRIVRERVVDLHQQVRNWAATNLRLASPKTLYYIDLLFAYAAARLGESTRARELAASAKREIVDSRDVVHNWLYRAFEFRISQAEQGKPLTGPLPISLVKTLEKIDRTEKYKIDRLREHSSILEPHEALDPYRDWKAYHVDAFDRRVNDLFDINSREKLLTAIKELFADKQALLERARLVTAALELSPRLGEKFAVKILGHVIPTDRKLDDPIPRAALLENGLEIAAHFDQRTLVPQLLDRLRGLLHDQQNADVKTLEALETVLMQSFRGLRRLGMREELARLLDEFAAVVRPADDDAPIEPERLRVLLRMAGGWFYFGQDRGWVDIDRARELLFDQTLLKEGHVGAMKQTQLAIAYVQAVGEAPLDDAFARWQELFAELEGIHDANVVNSHYSLKILDIVEALVLTMVSEGFTVDKTSQRWLDEEEYLIRRRIHADVRSASDND